MDYESKRLDHMGWIFANSKHNDEY